MTHHTGVAIAGAAAVAAAVSGGIAGASVAEATTLGIRAAELGQRRGQWVAGAAVARRIAWAIGLVDASHHDRSVRDIVELVGPAWRRRNRYRPPSPCSRCIPRTRGKPA